MQEYPGLPRAERGQETILLVEDEVNLRHLARQYLEKQGYRILEAEDGAAALQIAAGHKDKIDLLLTDVVMPGMNGRELATQITAQRPDVRVLYMSGYTENAIGHDGLLDAGITLLQKPFSLPTLKDRVRELMDSEPIPQESAAHASHRSGRGTQENPAVSCSALQPACAAALSSAGRKELASRNDRKYQPFRPAVSRSGIAPTQCAG